MSKYIGAELFTHEWKIATQNNDTYTMKKLLKGIAGHNYLLLQNERHKPQNTYKWYNSQINNELLSKIKYPGLQKGTVIFEEMTTDDAIVKYTSMGHKVVALNFASNGHPGGGYLEGAINVQEEELCRQYPRLYMSLEHAQNNGSYPIGLGNILMTPNIERMRENRNNGYAVINMRNVTCGFISTAAPNMNAGPNKHKTFDDFSADLKQAFKFIFMAPKCSKENYNVSLLGAWGVGVFAPHAPDKRIPYKVSMAQLMMQYVTKYRSLYDIVCIAIPDKTSENYQIFKAAFQNVDGIVFTS
jgi:uncharacterized protein (TIGR02452 family)